MAKIKMFSVSELGCQEIGLQEGLLETVLLCILQSPQYVPTDLRFDFFVLVCYILNFLGFILQTFVSGFRISGTHKEGI